MASEPPSPQKGPQSPLVSIICRTMGRPELEEALASAAGQTHSRLEIILVDAAARGEAAYRKVCADDRIALVLPDSPLSRPRAANAGLERARGEYLLFLDEDDWLAPDHVENLVNCLTGEQGVHAAYSSTRKTDVSGKATLETFQQPYDRLLLMRDNYIPIHSMLFAREPVDEGCRFDEDFDIFEDWDFWLQLSEHTDFHHIDRCTAFYRSGGASQTADLDDHLQRFDPEHQLGKARAAIYEKWLRRWDGVRLNRLLGAGQREQAESVKRIGELGRDLEKLARTKQKAERKAAELEFERDRLSLELNEARNAHVRMEARLNAVVRELQATNVALHDSVQHLRGNLEDVFNSNSWKLTRPYRALGELLKPGAAQTPAAQAAETGGGAPAEQKTPVRDSERRDQSHDFKAAFDRKALAAMDEFLASGEKLSFTTTDNPVLSVLLVFYNQAHLSLLCLRTLLENADVPFELIVVDNASGDRTGDLLARLENARLIRNPENLGFVKAVNQGAELAIGEYLLLLNNDAFIEPGAPGAAIDVLRQDASAGAVGGRIELLDGKLQEAGNVIWRDGSCAGYGRGENPGDGAFRFRREVDYCSGAFLMFRTAQFRELGGFDEAFAPAYYEESDFCLRLRRQGLRTVYEPRARVRHYEFASTGGMNAAVALQEKNRALFREKHAEFLEGQPTADPTRTLHARTGNGHPNVLLIDDAVPHASLGGGYPRCRHIVSLLSRMPLNVTFFPLHFPNDNWGEVYRTLPGNVEVLLNRGRSGLAQLLAERAGFYQYVMVSRPTNMAFFNQVLKSLPREARQFDIVYDAEAVFAGRELLWRELQGESVDEDEKERAISEELDLAAEASSVLTVSGAEADLFRGRGHDRVLVLGHGMEPVAEPAPFDVRQGLLFVGALKDEHSPNVDSLLWFVCNVLPLIEREIPELDLNVAGHTAAPSLVSIERQNIHLKGRLESLDGLYRDSRVFIAPTRFAAGIPHKVHEAAAHGVPAVVTSLLARQLGWRHEREVLVGDGPESFAEQCLRLYRDAGLWERISAAGREAVARDCSEERFRITLEELFRVREQDREQQ
ncbi:MAG: glycosyltransferase [Gammaproteobacteria bacterium]|nr:glycosyltransferase [Gammaproteobacteria bacterium]